MKRRKNLIIPSNVTCLWLPVFITNLRGHLRKQHNPISFVLDNTCDSLVLMVMVAQIVIHISWNHWSFNDPHKSSMGDILTSEGQKPHLGLTLPFSEHATNEELWSLITRVQTTSGFTFPQVQSPCPTLQPCLFLYSTNIPKFYPREVDLRIGAPTFSH